MLSSFTVQHRAAPWITSLMPGQQVGSFNRWRLVRGRAAFFLFPTHLPPLPPKAALRAKMLAEELAAGEGSGELATEVVEEFISIADGQLVLEGPPQRQQQLQQLQLQPAASSSLTPTEAAAPAYVVNPKLSITRIGTRAYYKALEHLAPQVRHVYGMYDVYRMCGVQLPCMGALLAAL
jgi:hypothetical protein